MPSQLRCKISNKSVMHKSPQYSPVLEYFPHSSITCELPPPALCLILIRRVLWAAIGFSLLWVFDYALIRVKILLA